MKIKRKSNISYFNAPKQSSVEPYKLIKCNINSTIIGSKNNIITATTLFINDCPAFFIASGSPDPAAFIKSIVPSTITNISAIYFTKFSDILIHFRTSFGTTSQPVTSVPGLYLSSGALSLFPPVDASLSMVVEEVLEPVPVYGFSFTILHTAGPPLLPS